MEQLVWISSVLKGLASGLLWISQGVYISKTITSFKQSNQSNHQEGFAIGIFFSIYNLNGIIGNLLTIVLLQNGYEVSIVILAMCIVATTGACMMVNDLLKKRYMLNHLQVYLNLILLLIIMENLVSEFIIDLTYLLNLYCILSIF